MSEVIETSQAAAEDASAHDFIELKSMEDVEKLEQKQIYDYIEKLHGIIRKYDTKIASYKQRLKHFLNKEAKNSEVKLANGEIKETKDNGVEGEEGKELSATAAFSFVDEMRQAAKHAENLNNFVYEPTSGLYYDPKTGYYYNAEYGLYYDGNTGCYYSYDQSKDSYEFHSQAQVQSESLRFLARFRNLRIDRMRCNALDIAKKYPPSLRIIVQETNVQDLTVGSLHLITYKGGSLGREGAHDVIIPDVNVSKCHLNFHYDTKQGVYKCRDLGSRNGTILNGYRMSESKEPSETLDLVHGSVISIGQTKLLCHVHEGNSTCGLCEPGLLIETQPAASAPAVAGNVLSHKEQLKKLQKKYGLENEKFVETSGNPNPNYNDRSAQRRIKVGSSTDKEKTEVACVHTEIASSNKGFKMLSQLGWQKGETLGKGNQGLLTPINVVANEGTTGLGSTDTSAKSVARSMDKRKLANLKITQARYQRAKDIFVLSDESD
ncbi:PREDICTED: angiogenic factor with G patch and FHA domains 1 isoform X2 [Drosophila arizonae]|uniref:Angiogenic factor with G patch and FHA domains 1 isoform X2 n=2 Tax=Drosophila arizonae TaxID=7263 RepID=A0ABM1PG14_DROAR|nr:PREDICTED: angiogenic factor with G patch and FHA domains 1 isoform X2 [Drosophila arizonae]